MYYLNGTTPTSNPNRFGNGTRYEGELKLFPGSELELSDHRAKGIYHCDIIAKNIVGAAAGLGLLRTAVVVYLQRKTSDEG